MDYLCADILLGCSAAEVDEDMTCLEDCDRVGRFIFAHCNSATLIIPGCVGIWCQFASKHLSEIPADTVTG